MENGRRLGQLLEAVTESPNQAAHLERFMQIDGTLIPRPVYAGNQVQLLIDGPMAFEAMFQAMKNARHHIHVETFILHDEQIGQRFADIVIDRRDAGVEVRVLYDAVGVLSTAETFFERLRNHGVELYKYNPIDPLENPKIWRINQRHHRKIIIVDGKIAFTGGMNISKVYRLSSFAPEGDRSALKSGWRDTNLKIRGPVVAVFQRMFIQMWQRHHGAPPLEGLSYFPELSRKDNRLVRVVESKAGDEAVDIYKVYLNAFAHARDRIWITQGYFSPDPRTLRILKEAANRRVDVRLLLPGLTDSWITVASSRAHYEELLRAGVRIFEQKENLQHSKTAVVDGLWSTVGSTNLDYRSFLHANEVNTIIYGRNFGRDMEAMFLMDQRQNTEILLEQWKHRSLLQRLKEYLGSAFDYWL